MAVVMGSVEQTRDNLITGSKTCLTDDVLPLNSGTLKRGEVVKKDGSGLVALADTADIPYAVLLVDTDASASTAKTTYTTDASLLGSQLTFGTGTLADFRDAFKTSTNLFIEE